MGLIAPPADASVGDRVIASGQNPLSVISKELKTKQWDAVKEGLKALKGVAAFNGVDLVAGPSLGKVTAEGKPDGAPIR